MPLYNVLVYAKWAPKTMTVTVHDAVNPVCDLYVVAGNPVSGMEMASKEGAGLAGWYLDEAFTIPFSFDKTIVEDIDIYALWLEDAKPSASSTTSTQAAPSFPKMICSASPTWINSTFMPTCLQAASSCTSLTATSSSTALPFPTTKTIPPSYPSC
jgi:hypothetical protein